MAPSATLLFTPPFVITAPAGFFRNSSRPLLLTRYDPSGLMATKGAESEGEREGDMELAGKVERRGWQEPEAERGICSAHEAKMYGRMQTRRSDWMGMAANNYKVLIK